MFGYSYRWMRPDDYLVQDEDLLARCNPIQSQLLGGAGGLYDREGRFHAFGTERPLDDWCAAHNIDEAQRHDPLLPVEMCSVI